MINAFTSSVLVFWTMLAPTAVAPREECDGCTHIYATHDVGNGDEEWLFIPAAGAPPRTAIAIRRHANGRGANSRESCRTRTTLVVHARSATALATLLSRRLDR